MLEVVEAGGLATIQDAGRIGWRRFGVPASGPMDRFAFEAANRLAGNEPHTAVLEIGGGDVTLRAVHDCVIAATGAGYQISINSWEFSMWGSYLVRGGWSIQVSRHGFGMWAYLSIMGGFDISPVLGSRSTYLRGRFGGLAGRAIQPGDILRVANPPRQLIETAARTLSEDARPGYTPSPTVDVIMGPQSDRFAEEDLAAFFSSAYRISPASDRMGYRLEGTALAGQRQKELTSEGMAAGSVQVPADGQPIVMMADCATTGGYPKIACITSATLPLLAQCTPGSDEVRFRQVTVETAQASYRSMMERLKTGIIEAEG
jgi:antagonist of KipI